MKRLVRLATQIIVFGFLALAADPAVRAMPSYCVSGSNIYYISQIGSDANSQTQARSKSTPWKHAPYMASFTGIYSHTAGDCFIFKGGEAWVNADHFTFSNGGTASTPDYYGVDQTWYIGPSWSRPIFDNQGISSPQNL